MNTMPMRAIGIIVTATLTCLACGTDTPPGAGPSSLTAAGDALFADDFESGTLAAWQDGVDPARHRVVTDPASAQSGSRYLAATYPSGRDAGWLTRFFMPGYESLSASFYVRFPSDWRGSTKLLAFYGSRTDDQWSAFGKAGLCPNGSDFFAAMVVTEADGGNPGPSRFYAYYPAMRREPDGRTCWGRFGDGSETYVMPLTLSRGAWHRIEFAVTLNTPGRADAMQTFKIDGVERGRWGGVSFRDTPALLLNAVQLSFSASGGAPGTQELHIDNVVVRTGPAAR